MKAAFGCIPFVLAITFTPLNPVVAQGGPSPGTAFSYQGHLLAGGASVNGSYDVVFRLIDPNCACAVAARTNLNLSVQGGVFTTLVDFGAVFDGTAYSLQLAVRPSPPPGGGGPFTDLVPAVQLVATPYADFAASLGGVSAAGFWRTGGNPSPPGMMNFLGTADNNPLVLGANAQAGLRISPVPTGSGGVPDIIGGSSGNFIAEGLSGSSIGGGGWNYRFTCSLAANAILANNSFIGSGTGNTIATGADGSVIGGGDCHLIDTNSAEAFIGGGFHNIIKSTININGSVSTIAGGSANSVGLNDFASAIGGGLNNHVGDNITEGTIAGGFANTISAGNSSIIAGGQANRIFTGQGTTISGGQNNQVSAHYAAIVGGNGNHVESGSTASFIGGGSNNTVQANSNPYAAESMGAVLCGGLHNTIDPSGAMSTLGGGRQNTIGNFAAFIGGGQLNSVEGVSSVVVGGESNDAQGPLGFIGGGENNVISGGKGVIPGGDHNAVSGENSFAGGYYAKANNTGCFIWADTGPGFSIAFNSSSDNEFAARARGGVRFVTAVDGSGNPTAGVAVGSGGTSWSSICDRNAKKNFVPVKGDQVLAKLAALPVQSWNYKWEADDAVPHIGPMAQDFKHAFYPGRDDTTISTLEFDGVELAAIQGLNQKLAEKESEIRQQADQIQTLRQEVDELKSLVRQFARSRPQQP